MMIEDGNARLVQNKESSVMELCSDGVFFYIESVNAGI